MRANLPRVIEPFSAPLTDALLAINEASFPSEWGERWSDQDLLGALALPGVSATLVGDGDRALFGFLLSRVVVDEAEILLIAVLPESRGTGIALHLLDHFMQSTAAHCLRKVFLEVRETNMPARALYQKMGFEKIGRRENYYKGASGKRAAAITLAKYL